MRSRARQGGPPYGGLWRGRAPLPRGCRGGRKRPNHRNPPPHPPEEDDIDDGAQENREPRRLPEDLLHEAPQEEGRRSPGRGSSAARREGVSGHSLCAAAGRHTLYREGRGTHQKGGARAHEGGPHGEEKEDPDGGRHDVEERRKGRKGGDVGKRYFATIPQRAAMTTMGMVIRLPATMPAFRPSCSPLKRPH